MKHRHLPASGTLLVWVLGGILHASLAHAAGAELLCLTEQPAIVAGESATLRVWASTASGAPVSGLRYQWTVSAGRIEEQDGTTRWNLSAVTVPPGQARKAQATVTAAAPGGQTLTCSVEVYIGAQGPKILTRGVNLISAKHYLLPSATEAPGYGLYSYLLFSAPPHNAEQKARYLKTIEACVLMLRDVDDYLSRHVRPRDLNVTYIPVNYVPQHGSTDEQWAQNVLAAYDYARAQILLNQVDRSHEDGPYLVSELAPLSQPSQSGGSPHLWEDLSGVVPELAWDWMKYFTYLAAQQRSWSQVTLQQFGLNLRNLIAVGGKVAPTTAAALGQLIRFAKD